MPCQLLLTTFKVMENCTIIGTNQSTSYLSCGLKDRLQDNFFCSTAPSTAPSPLVLHDYTSQSINLVWESPPEEDINGILRQFVIRVVEHETGRIFTNTSSYEQITLLDLHPYYTYSVSVAAETIDTGPFSNNITIQLAEEGKRSIFSQRIYLHDLMLLQHPHQHQKISRGMQ